MLILLCVSITEDSVYHHSLFPLIWNVKGTRQSHHRDDSVVFPLLQWVKEVCVCVHFCMCVCRSSLITDSLFFSAPLLNFLHRFLLVSECVGNMPMTVFSFHRIRWHGSAVVTPVSSQQVGPTFESWTAHLCVDFAPGSSCSPNTCS